MLVQIRRLPRKLTILLNRTAARHPLYLQHQMSRRALRSERSVPAREERWRGVQMTSRLTTMRKGELRHDARKRDSVVPRNTSLIRYSLVRCAPAERRKRATL
jgi:hypothetical protein